MVAYLQPLWGLERNVVYDFDKGSLSNLHVDSTYPSPHSSGLSFQEWLRCTASGIVSRRAAVQWMVVREDMAAWSSLVAQSLCAIRRTRYGHVWGTKDEIVLHEGINVKVLVWV